MKWMKRTAALLAALLLLPVSAQAKSPFKAHARTTDALIRVEPAWEGPEVRKIPVLPVLPVLPELEAGPALGSSLPKAGGEAAASPAQEPAKPGSATPAENTAKPSSAASVEETAKTISEYLDTEDVEGASARFPEAEDWQLLLVNPWNEVPEGYQVDLKPLSNGLKIDAKAYDSLNDMLQACRDAGLAPSVISAYRTQSKQTSLYNNKIARLRNAGYSKSAAEKEAGRWVARPGTSEHQLGLAVDIVSSSYTGLTKKQEQTKEQKWLMEHCWEYGFILRYPNDKSEITGIGYEPWHYRYVGVDVAQDVRDSGLCFEEYLLLRAETLAERNGSNNYM